MILVRQSLLKKATADYWDGRHVVYRCYEGDTLLYIGASSYPAQRMTKHRQQTPWWPRVTKVAVKVYPTRWDAFSTESQAIQAERPELNKLSDFRPGVASQRTVLPLVVRRAGGAA